MQNNEIYNSQLKYSFDVNEAASKKKFPRWIFGVILINLIWPVILLYVLGVIGGDGIGSNIKEDIYSLMESPGQILAHQHDGQSPLLVNTTVNGTVYQFPNNIVIETEGEVPKLLQDIHNYFIVNTITRENSTVKISSYVQQGPPTNVRQSSGKVITEDGEEIFFQVQYMKFDGEWKLVGIDFQNVIIKDI